MYPSVTKIKLVLALGHSILSELITLNLILDKEEAWRCPQVLPEQLEEKDGGLSVLGNHGQ